MSKLIRNQFEEWAESWGWGSEKDSEGYYEDTTTQMAWNAWVKQGGRIAELEREKAELVAQVEVLKQLAEPAIKLMRATGNSSGWHKKADELELVVNSKLTTQCLNQIKAEAGSAGFIAGWEACQKEMPEPFNVMVTCNYAALSERYGASIAKGE